MIKFILLLGVLGMLAIIATFVIFLGWKVASVIVLFWLMFVKHTYFGEAT